MKPAIEIRIAGCGVVTPFAAGRAGEVLSAARESRFPGDDDYWRVPDDFLAQVPDLAKELRQDHASWITALALTHACDDASIHLGEFAPQRIGLVLGNAFAGQLGMIDFAAEVREQTPRFVSPIHFPQTVGNYVAGAMSRAFTIQGPNLTLAAGASSGLAAVAKACALLADGAADLAVAGGVEVFSADLVRGLGGSQTGSDHSAVWAEGACLYVLLPDRAQGSGPTSAGGGPRIVEWALAAHPHAHASVDMPPRAARDDDDAALTYLVGRSLAAESALRVAARMQTMQPGERWTVTHDQVVITLAA